MLYKRPSQETDAALGFSQKALYLMNEVGGQSFYSGMGDDLLSSRTQSGVLRLFKSSVGRYT